MYVYVHVYSISTACMCILILVLHDFEEFSVSLLDSHSVSDQYLNEDSMVIIYSIRGAAVTLGLGLMIRLGLMIIFMMRPHRLVE